MGALFFGFTTKYVHVNTAPSGTESFDYFVFKFILYLDFVHWDHSNL
jgi:hypothetical protein